MLMTLLQKIRSDAYTSFSVLGLGLVFTIGGLLIGLGYTLEPLTEYASKRWHRGTYQRLEWSANGTLQLQRLSQEAVGWGIWTATTEFVPVAQAGDILAPLDVRNIDHPKLLQRASVNATVGGSTSLDVSLQNGKGSTAPSIE